MYRKPISRVEGRRNFVPLKKNDKREEVSKVYKPIEGQKSKQQHVSSCKTDILEVDNNKGPDVLEISKLVRLNDENCFNVLVDLEEGEIVQSINVVTIDEEINTCNGTNVIANAAGREDKGVSNSEFYESENTESEGKVVSSQSTRKNISK
ncbi:hypothetical protein MA16_Dca018310 [Dendrobium catenatum]|uniref:Uncharacterized protein n=1 Tax=Dendrobium catenatum TaxID=906689 RepID=A0A2I0WJG9_9ASPA|nr:hypothetical protein MA16_Dca018310 [Dendrobium catenatum]